MGARGCVRDYSASTTGSVCLHARRRPLMESRGVAYRCDDFTENVTDVVFSNGDAHARRPSATVAVMRLATLLIFASQAFAAITTIADDAAFESEIMMSSNCWAVLFRVETRRRRRPGNKDYRAFGRVAAWTVDRDCRCGRCESCVLRV